jgi:hypothetical protein
VNPDRFEGQQAMNFPRDAHSPTARSRADAVDTALLAAGILAVALYGVGDLVSGLLYTGYSFRDQAISELSAVGSPVRPLMVTVILIHALLMTAFGVGIWRSAGRRSLRWAGLCLVATGLIGFPTHTVFAMSSRWLPTGFNDAMHIALTSVFSLFVSVALVLSAVAYRGWFRWYAIATLLVIAGFGAAASSAIQGLAQNATPWAGGFERINAYTYFAWIVVLAVITMRRLSASPHGPGASSGGGRTDS